MLRKDADSARHTHSFVRKPIKTEEAYKIPDWHTPEPSAPFWQESAAFHPESLFRGAERVVCRPEDSGAGAGMGGA